MRGTPSTVVGVIAAMILLGCTNAGATSPPGGGGGGGDDTAGSSGPPPSADAGGGAADAGRGGDDGATQPDGGTASAPPACATDLAPSLAQLGVPGLSASVVKKGRVVCTAVAGTAVLGSSTPVTPATDFLWASVSKTVTATAVMQLYEQGKFRL